MSTAKVKMTVAWCVPVGRSRSVVDALQTLMVDARSEPGFISSSLSTELQKQVGLRYTEEWASEDHLRRILRSEHFSRLASLIDEGNSSPSVAFTLPEGTRGLEYVTQVRES